MDLNSEHQADGREDKLAQMVYSLRCIGASRAWICSSEIGEPAQISSRHIPRLFLTLRIGHAAEQEGHDKGCKCIQTPLRVHAVSCCSAS